MSLVLEKQAFALPLADTSAKLLLVAMCHLSAHGEVYASRYTLERMTGLCSRSITRKKKYLIEQNLLKKMKSDHYFINLKKDNLSSKKDNLSKKKDNLSTKKDNLSTPLYSKHNNGMNGENDGLTINILDSRLKEMYFRKKQHPGNPDIPNAVDRDHPDREAYWQLCKLEKSMQAALDERMQQATQK